MHIKRTILIITSLLLVTIARGQNYETSSQVIENIIESIAAGTEEELDYSEITADLEYYFENPLNINTATIEELEKLIMLNDFQIKNLIHYIRRYGEIKTVYELKYIEGFSYTTIIQMLPFIAIDGQNTSKKWSVKKGLKYGNHQVFVRTTTLIQDAVGYEDVSDSIRSSNLEKYYPGNKHRLYSRYKFNYKNKLLWGLTAEKDPGEQFFQGEQKYGFDFYSAHLQIKDIGPIKNLVLGDFQGQFGQGLVMWSYLSNSKSTYVMDIRKRGQGLRKYSSTDENAFLRGMGATLNFRNIDFTVFASYKKMDASYQTVDTIDNETAFFSAFDNSGIHATPNQIEKKDAITESLMGSNITWVNRKLKVGVTGITYKFNVPLLKDTTLYNQFDFRGIENYNVSADFQYMFRKIHFFGEAAMSKNGGTAYLAGALLELTSQLKASVLYRNYSPDYFSAYSNAFAESSSNKNEKGLYFGVEMNPLRKLKLSAFYDYFSFPWLKQSASSPTKGNEYFLRADFLASRNVLMYASIKSENKETNIDEDNTGISSLGNVENISAQYQISYSAGDNWKFRNRIAYHYYENISSESGYMLFQDIICKPFRAPLKIVFRYAFFDTDSYNSRIYAYESDVLYAYSVPAMYDQGTRTYLMLKYTLGEKLDLWFRYSQTRYTNKKSIGSGLNEIEGNLKSEIKFQLRWKI